MDNFEIERKFLIEYPDTDILEKYPGSTKSEITQMYLDCPEGISERIRKRTTNGNTVYYHTCKIRISDMRRIENEDVITEDEYLHLAEKKSSCRSVISKTRYCLPYGPHIIEVDVFPFWSNAAVAEIELSDENEQFSLPDCITVIREITDDRRFTNASLSKLLFKDSVENLPNEFIY